MTRVLVDTDVLIEHLRGHHRFATGKDDFQTKHVISCCTVFHTMNAARVFRDVSTDGASRLTGRIGDVMQTEMRDRA